ncbi:malonate decarboxylase subunit delta [Planococcus sp. CPCC 101016]|uniref:malonate decarboxylase subunit delta n=1 Tax=Planococcus sp. CPCC 101016 TaxID=2599617 RepID=UPI0011B826D2|nr:malonate decarboxylase subunit delta [Planococcus sp. CPCC 101016]TWT08034.1 malonate decarboxylase subunit delta [Planococcus sp. CPCC 101016]
MENFTFTFPATNQINRFAHVGVVGSGDLEVLIEPSSELQTEVIIRTGIIGFGATWESLIQRFFAQHDIAAKVKINDFGATPGVVKLRLEQALEVAADE